MVEFLPGAIDRQRRTPLMNLRLAAFRLVGKGLVAILSGFPGFDQGASVEGVVRSKAFMTGTIP
jgi:hypothetical protein